MNTLLRRLKSAFPFVGTRAAIDDDLFGFCADRDIELVFSPDVSAGIYAMYRGEHFIFLNSRLSGRRLLHVAFHEIGHYLLHVPTQGRYAAEFFRLHQKQKDHCEAESVAAFLLLPIAELESLLLAGVHERDHELAELIGRRLELFARYKV